MAIGEIESLGAPVPIPIVDPQNTTSTIPTKEMNASVIESIVGFRKFNEYFSDILAIRSTLYLKNNAEKKNKRFTKTFNDFKNLISKLNDLENSISEINEILNKEEANEINYSNNADSSIFEKLASISVHLKKLLDILHLIL